MSDAEHTPAIHDMGGLSRFRCSPVERDEAPPDAFGKRVDALRQILAAKKLMTVDELRRGIESIPEPEYFALGYYERWMTSICTLMLEKGIVSAEELR
ncbi:SH3-like domain-containing protein [Roseicella aquatilis]|uniref:Nitrile hydratase subunit beta n=1 Tax=Roseicella aquatilis TaxID=2527868 RepID=A0A4R4DSZ7_9PROT|nr:SH3-like domain-containing protein [Roseicella aquatilis]TCZ64515.1 nitrile hydratase subunit beta [Roseicella aquatilis]